MLLGRYKEAGLTLEKAEQLLEKTQKNPIYAKIRKLIREARSLEFEQSIQVQHSREAGWTRSHGGVHQSHCIGI